MSASQTTRAEALTQLVADVAADVRDYAWLEAELDKQHAAILGHDVNALQAFAEVSAARLADIERRSVARAHLLVDGIGSTTAMSIEPALALLAREQRREVAAQWQMLKEAAARCKEKNIRNAEQMGMQAEIISQWLTPAAPTYEPR